MRFLSEERTTLESLLPGVDAALAAIPLLDMERPGNPAIPAFRRLGGPALLVPERFGGRGATALQAVRAQRAIACRAPSLAVATAMHHFTIAGVADAGPDMPAADAELLTAVAADNLYVGSGFAESQPGTSIHSSRLHVAPGADGFVLNGSKKPCSLSASMDVFVVSAPDPNGAANSLAVAVLPADTPGLDRQPFWNSPILAGAESDEVVLRDVRVPADAFFPLGGSGKANPVQDAALLWFEMLVTSTYIGVASNLAERAFAAGRGGATDRVAVAAELEGAMAAVEGIARGVDAGDRRNDDLGRMLLVRYAVHGQIDRATARAVEVLGAAEFIRNPEVAYLLAASRVLTLHPPSRVRAETRLDDFLAGQPFVVD